MKYKIKWTNKSGTEGYGLYVYDTKEKADKIADELNKNGDTSTYVVVEAE